MEDLLQSSWVPFSYESDAPKLVVFLLKFPVTPTTNTSSPLKKDPPICVSEGFQHFSFWLYRETISLLAISSGYSFRIQVGRPPILHYTWVDWSVCTAPNAPGQPAGQA